MMNRLQRLQQQLETIPAKRTRAVLVNRLAEYEGKISATAAKLRGASRSETFARQVFPDMPEGRMEAQLAHARRSAGALHKRLSQEIKSVEGKKTEDAVVHLGEIADKVELSVRSRWSNFLTTKLQGYEALINAIEQAGIARSADLVRALAYLQQQTKPPTSSGAVEAIRGALDKVTGAIAALGLEGEVGDFVIDTARGRGDPRALLNPSIQRFVEANNLWPLLKVKFQ
jgi:hypothetical protein